MPPTSSRDRLLILIDAYSCPTRITPSPVGSTLSRQKAHSLHRVRRSTHQIQMSSFTWPRVSHSLFWTKKLPSYFVISFCSHFLFLTELGKLWIFKHGHEYSCCIHYFRKRLCRSMHLFHTSFQQVFLLFIKFIVLYVGKKQHFTNTFLSFVIIRLTNVHSLIWLRSTGTCSIPVLYWWKWRSAWNIGWTCECAWIAE